MTAPLLQLQDVVAGYGPITVLNGLSLAVAPQEKLALIGRNGVGKTTTLRTIMGLWQASAGSITFRGQPLHGRATPDIAADGIAYVPENMGIFSSSDASITSTANIGTSPTSERSRSGLASPVSVTSES